MKECKKASYSSPSAEVYFISSGPSLLEELSSDGVATDFEPGGVLDTSEYVPNNE